MGSRMEQLEAELAGAAARLEDDLRELARAEVRAQLAAVVDGLVAGAAPPPKAPPPKRRPGQKVSQRPFDTGHRCALCQEKGHNRRTCPRGAAPEPPPTPPPVTSSAAASPPPAPPPKPKLDASVQPPPRRPLSASERPPGRTLPLRPEALATSPLAARQRLIADRARRMARPTLAIETLEDLDDLPDAGDVAGEEETRA